MTKRLQIGVLLVEDAQFWGGMTGLWKHFVKRFSQCSDTIQLLPIDAISGNLPTLESELKSYDGFIITGSNYSVNDDFPWIKRLMSFIRFIHNLNTHRVFGICFGHQLIAKALGCEVGRNMSGEDVFGTQLVQVHDNLRTKDFFRRVFGKRDEIWMMEGHGESVLSIPTDISCEVLGSSDTCSYEVLGWSENIISTQGHPEFDVDVMANKIAPMVKEHEFLSDEQLKKSLKSFSDIDTDNTVKFVASFFRG